MNLSQVLGELEPNPLEDSKPKFRAEEARLVKIIEALQEVQSSKAWSTLKNEVFDNVVNILDKDIRQEARKEEPAPTILNRLSGELKWAERYADLDKLANTYKVQLQSVRKQLYGNTE